MKFELFSGSSSAKYCLFGVYSHFIHSFSHVFSAAKQNGSVKYSNFFFFYYPYFCLFLLGLGFVIFVVLRCDWHVKVSPISVFCDFSLLLFLESYVLVCSVLSWRFPENSIFLLASQANSVFHSLNLSESIGSRFCLSRFTLFSFTFFFLRGRESKAFSVEANFLFDSDSFCHSLFGF